jgi:hypothetical protein
VPTTDCIAQIEFEFQGQKRRIDLKADAPNCSSDGGVLALRRIDEQLGLTAALARVIDDRRIAARCRHSTREQLRQRVYQIALGYEDCNDADSLRDDPLWQVVARDGDPGPLASQPTLSRFENGIRGRQLRELWRVLEAHYVTSLDPDAALIVLDIDSTDDPTHGQQELAFFHGFYDQHMYHPLLVFDGETGQLVSGVLRPGRAHASWGASGLLRRLIRAIRARCPHAAIVVRGDSAFAMPWLLDGLDSLHAELGHVYYVLGLARNPRLLDLAAPAMARAASAHDASGAHVREFVWLDYAAASWSRVRRVVAKAEHGERGDNPRFVVTNIDWVTPRSIYDGAFCPRGQAENYIKDLKNALRADRLSCHRFLANAFRLLLHAVAYRLMHALRASLGKIDARLGRIQMDTLRLWLLKVAAVVQVSVRRVLIRIPTAFRWRAPLLELFAPDST